MVFASYCVFSKVIEGGSSDQVSHTFWLISWLHEHLPSHPFQRLFRFLGEVEEKRGNGHWKVSRTLVCAVNTYQGDTAAVERGPKDRATCFTESCFPISPPFPLPPSTDWKILLAYTDSPKHLCPPDCPLWIFPGVLTSAGWCLHGNRQWGEGCGGSSVHLSSMATALFCLVCALHWVLEEAEQSRGVELKGCSCLLKLGVEEYNGGNWLQREPGMEIITEGPPSPEESLSVTQVFVLGGRAAFVSTQRSMFFCFWIKRKDILQPPHNIE